MLIYEENDGDYLTVTFKGDDTSEEDIIISYSYYTNDTIVDEKNKHWKDALKVINSWKDQ